MEATSAALSQSASFMDMRIRSWNHNVEPQCQKYKGPVVYRVDMVKDDSVSNAVFVEQGSSASQTNDGRKSDGWHARQPGCAAQAADAVSAQTKVKMEDAPKLLKFPKSERTDIWIRLPRHKWPKLSPHCSSATKSKSSCQK